MSAMEQLLNKLCNEGPAALQVVFKNGGVMAGALTRTPIEGLFQLRTVMHRSNTSQAEALDVFFSSDEVSNVVVQVEKPVIAVVPTIVQPGSP